MNPQLWIGYYEQDAVDTTVSKELNLPLNPIQGTGRRPQIVEILKVFWHFKPLPQIAQATMEQDYHWGALSTLDHGANDMEGGERDLISYCRFGQKGAFTALGSCMQFEHNDYVQDLTDGAGHGVIVATPRLYVQIGSNLHNDHGVDLGIQILYRFKAVGLPEYIGVVSSQLSGNAV